MSNFTLSNLVQEGVLSVSVYDPLVDVWSPLQDWSSFLTNRAMHKTVTGAPSFTNTPQVNQARLILHTTTPQTLDAITLAGLTILEGMSYKVLADDVNHPTIPTTLIDSFTQTTPVRPRTLSNQILSFEETTATCFMVEFEWNDATEIDNAEFKNLLINGDFAQQSNGWTVVDSFLVTAAGPAVTFNGSSARINSGSVSGSDGVDQTISLPEFGFPVNMEFSLNLVELSGAATAGINNEHQTRMEFHNDDGFVTGVTTFQDGAHQNTNQFPDGFHIVQIRTNLNPATPNVNFFQGIKMSLPADLGVNPRLELEIRRNDASVLLEISDVNFSVDLNGVYYRGTPFDIQGIGFAKKVFQPENWNADADSIFDDTVNVSDINSESTLIRRRKFNSRMHSLEVKNLTDLETRDLTHLIVHTLPIDGYCLYRRDPESDNPEEYFLGYVKHTPHRDEGGNYTVMIEIKEVREWR